MRELRTKAEADAALGGSGVIYKHSTRCPVSTDAYSEVAAFALAHPSVTVHIVDVILARDVSQHIARATGILHQSPQVIVVEEGAVRWHGSHYTISTNALEEHVPCSPPSAPSAPLR